MPHSLDMQDLDDPVDLKWLLQHKRLMLVSRNGLGDNMVAAGLANWLSQHVELVFVPVRNSYWQSVNWMYADCKNIVPVGVDPSCNWNNLQELAASLNSQLCKTILDYPVRSGTPWFRACYEQYHLHYQTRFHCWPSVKPGPNAHKLFERLIKNKNYVVIHNNSAERNSYSIDLLQDRSAHHFDNCQLLHIDPSLSNNIWDWLIILQQAQEIHLVPSSVFCLCEQMDSTLSGQVYVHHIRDFTQFEYQRDIQPYHPRWIWIDYPCKQY